MRAPVASLFVLAVNATLASLAAPAFADALSSTLGEPLMEVEHEVSVTLGATHATLVVRRTFANAGTLHDEASLDIALPAGGAGTGLRIRARDVWYAGTLLEAEKAALLYEQLTALGAHRPSDPALLSWDWPGALHLQVFPVAPGGTATVEYTITAPLDYAEGRYVVAYPWAPGDGLARPAFRIAPDSAHARYEVDGHRVAAGVRVPAPSDAAIEIAALPDPIDVVAARFGRVVIEGDDAFVRIEVDAAPALAPLPRDLSVVFVLDASRSVGEERIAAQLQVAAAFLAHVPDASFEVVAFRRRAERVLGAFAPAGEWAPRISRAVADGRLSPGNGSALDAGLLVALEALRGRDGPATIVALTDGLLRERLDPAALAALVARSAGRTTLHVALAETGSGAPADFRDVSHPLAPVAHAAGGIVLRIGDASPGADVPPPGRAPDAALVRVVEGLVRPVRIDAFRVLGMDGGTAWSGSSATDLDDGRAWDGADDGADLESALWAGAGYRAATRAAAAPRTVTIKGLVWARPFERVVAVDAAFSRAAAAFAVAEERLGDLTPEEALRVATYARAVSPVTSYLAVEPGTRPSTAGLVRGGVGVGVGLAGLGLYGWGSSGCGVGFVTATPSLADLLREAAAECAAALDRAPAPASVTVEVETTYREVVDVGARGGEPALAACLAEAAWSLDLDARFEWEHETFTASLP